MLFSCRRVVVLTQMDNTQAEVGIEFNKTASAEELPENADVVKTLVDSVSNPNNTFNLTIQADSIQIIRK